MEDALPDVNIRLKESSHLLHPQHTEEPGRRLHFHQAKPDESRSIVEDGADG
jgi:hypothetical protein